MIRGDEVEDMNEGDAPYLRARAKRYRQVARDTSDRTASEELKRIAQGYEDDAQSIADRRGDGEPDPGRNAEGPAAS